MVSGKKIIKESNNLTSISDVKKILRKHDFHLSKRLGQHFLIDGNIRDNIINAADIKPDDIILEIGPGIGTLTEIIAKICDRLIVIELDRRLETILKETTNELDNVTIFIGDALKFEIRKLSDLGKLPNKLISNLPYNISSTLLIRYLQDFDFIKSYTVMVQKEVADRMVAAVGSKDYGAFTIKLSFLATINRKFNISKNVFIPPPNVESSLLTIKRNNEIDDVYNAGLFRLIEAAFSQRRKKLINSVSDTYGLKKEFLLEAMEEIGQKSDVRAETLSPGEYRDLFDAIEKRAD